VQEITTVQVERQVRMIAADDLGAAARDLARLLVEEEGLFAGWKGGVEAPAPAPTQRAKTSDRAVWVTAELYGGQLRPVTLELLGEAVNLATRLGSEVGVLLLGHWPAAESAYSERTAPANGRIASAPGTPAPATQAPFSVMAGEGATVEPASSSTRGPSSVDAGEGAPVGPAAPATRGPSSAAAGEGALQAWPESVGLDALIERLGAHGADVVYVADDPRLAHYDTELYSGILADAIERLRPYAVLLPSTANGRDWAPRVAARLELGLTGDCIGFELNDDDLLVQLKPAFGGNIVAPILSKTLPQMATVRPGVLRALQPNPARTARVERLTIEHLPPSRVEWLSAEPSVGAAGIELETADTVVGVGFGLGGPDNLPVVNELAGVLGASVAATRKIVDLGWLPRQQQVGLTGKVISPRLYFAVGIRGFFNHTIGIQKAHTVVAINRDPEAAIFQVANYGVAADAVEFLPLLTRELREAKAGAAKS
jgi:electron transfer flavoprotein alpha subunit